MARALGRSESLFRLLELATEEARLAIDAASVSVSRLVPGSLTVRTLINVGDLGPDEERWPEDETYEMTHFANLELVVGELQTWIASIDDLTSDEDERKLLAQLGKGSSVGAPIVVDGHLWGEFYATRHVGDRTFDRNEVAYLEALIAILAGAISRSLREESLERLAYQDPLTGLPNRRALDEHAARVFDVPHDGSRTVTVVQVDINRLKEVNDTLGHVAGDQLIQSVGRALDAEFSGLPGSLVARVGGDEFTVLVTGHDPSTVLTVSDRLAQRTWRFGQGAGVSCGAATAVVTPGGHVSTHDLFAAADRAQYVAKHGRLSSTVMSDELDDRS
ncbi:MAG: sensor domain-containing diguanylate cyclase [Nocardioidaceae bacterium]|nr:sensor domain-containing diguanylate cyclase [Nocardioidaceae bacterium]